MHYYKFNIADWSKDTAHLTLKEEAILLRLFNFYINHERCIPLKTQMVLRKLRMGDESEAVDILLEEFFIKTKDGWVNEDLEKLITEYQKRADKNRANGKSGGRPKNNDLEKPSGLPVDTEEKPNGNLNQELETNNHKPKTKEPKKPKGDKLDWSALQMSESEIKEIQQLRKSAKAVVTQRVINDLANQFNKSRSRGYTNEDILLEWSTKGWRSYKDEWMKAPIKVVKQQVQYSNQDMLKGLEDL